MEKDTIYETIYETIRIKLKVSEPRATVTDPDSVASLLKNILSGLDADQEHFIILTLNKANAVTGYKLVHTGGQDETLCDPRSIFRHALLMGATALILCHNHPSGRPEPSAEDRALTAKLASAGKMLGIKILDHIIIGGDSFSSFAARGLLDFIA